MALWSGLLLLAGCLGSATCLWCYNCSSAHTSRHACPGKLYHPDTPYYVPGRAVECNAEAEEPVVLNLTATCEYKFEEFVNPKHFDVVANEHAKIILRPDKTEGSPMLEIILGADENTKSIVRRYTQTRSVKKKEYHPYGILEKQHYKRYMVEWLNGTITFYEISIKSTKVNKKTQIIQWIDDSPEELTAPEYFGVTTIGSEGIWKFVYPELNMTVHTKGTGVYATLLSKPANGNITIVFRLAAATKVAKIALMHNDSILVYPFYEIVLNQTSSKVYIIVSRQITLKSERVNKTVIRNGMFESFSITKQKESITVKHGDKEILSCKDKKAIDVKYFSVCTTHGAVGTWRIDGKPDIETPNLHNYTKFMKLKETNSIQKLKFSVKTWSDAQILLTKTKAYKLPYYEIFIGTESNKKSKIERQRVNHTMVKKETVAGQILVGNKFTGFILNWRDGDISVTKHGDTKPFLQFIDPEPFKIDNIRISTDYEAALWNFSPGPKMQTSGKMESEDVLNLRSQNVYLDLCAKSDARIVLEEGKKSSPTMYNQQTTPTKSKYEIIIGEDNKISKILHYRERKKKLKDYTSSGFLYDQVIQNGHYKYFTVKVSQLKGLELYKRNESEPICNWKVPSDDWFDVKFFTLYSVGKAKWVVNGSNTIHITDQKMNASYLPFTGGILNFMVASEKNNKIFIKLMPRKFAKTDATAPAHEIMIEHRACQINFYRRLKDSLVDKEYPFNFIGHGWYKSNRIEITRDSYPKMTYRLFDCRLIEEKYIMEWTSPHILLHYAFYSSGKFAIWKLGDKYEKTINTTDQISYDPFYDVRSSEGIKFQVCSRGPTYIYFGEHDRTNEGNYILSIDRLKVNLSVTANQRGINLTIVKEEKKEFVYVEFNISWNLLTLDFGLEAKIFNRRNETAICHYHHEDDAIPFNFSFIAFLYGSVHEVLYYAGKEYYASPESDRYIFPYKPKVHERIEMSAKIVGGIRVYLLPRIGHDPFLQCPLAGYDLFYMVSTYSQVKYCNLGRLKEKSQESKPAYIGGQAFSEHLNIKHQEYNNFDEWCEYDRFVISTLYGLCVHYVFYDTLLFVSQVYPTVLYFGLASEGADPRTWIVKDSWSASSTTSPINVTTSNMEYKFFKAWPSKHNQLDVHVKTNGPVYIKLICQEGSENVTYVIQLGKESKRNWIGLHSDRILANKEYNKTRGLGEDLLSSTRESDAFRISWTKKKISVRKSSDADPFLVWTKDATQDPLNMTILGFKGDGSKFNFTEPRWGARTGTEKYKATYLRTTKNYIDFEVQSKNRSRTYIKLQSTGKGNPVYEIIFGAENNTKVILNMYTYLGKKEVEVDTPKILKGDKETKFCYEDGLVVSWQRNKIKFNYQTRRPSEPLLEYKDTPPIIDIRNIILGSDKLAIWKVSSSSALKTNKTRFPLNANEDTKEFKFSVNATDDIYIQLAADINPRDDYFTLKITKKANATVTLTKTFFEFSLMDSKDTPGILKGIIANNELSNFDIFIVDWMNGNITVRRRGDEPFIQWTDRHPFDVTYYGVKSGVNASWRLPGVDETIRTVANAPFSNFFLPLRARSVEFGVKAEKDVYFRLFASLKQYDTVITVMIDIDRKYCQIQKRYVETEVKAVKDKNDLFENGPYSKYDWLWVDWMNGTISAGRQGYEAFIKWTDPDPITVTHYTARTHYTAPGRWSIEGLSGDVVTDKGVAVLNSIQEGQTRLNFKVQAVASVRVALHDGLEHYDPFYEVWIGEKNNTESVIRKIVTTIKVVVTEKTEDILDPNQYTPFWLEWKNGTLRVGRVSDGVNSSFIEYKEPEPFPINYMGVSSAPKGPSSWRLQGAFTTRMCFVRSYRARSHYAWIEQRGCYNATAQEEKDILPFELISPTEQLTCVHQRLPDGEHKLCLCTGNFCNGFAKALKLSETKTSIIIAAIMLHFGLR